MCYILQNKKTSKVIERSAISTVLRLEIQCQNCKILMNSAYSFGKVTSFIIEYLLHRKIPLSQTSVSPHNIIPFGV